MGCIRIRSLLTKNWGWVVTVAATILYTMTYGYMYSYGLLMVELRKEFDGDLTTAGYIGTVAYGLANICTVFITPLALKLGFRLVAFVSVIICASSSLISSFVPRLELMFLSYSLLSGVGLSGIAITGINGILRYIPTKHSSTALGIASAGISAGVLFMNPLLFLLLSTYGWRTTMQIMSAVILVSCLPCTLTYSKSESGHTSEETELSSPDTKMDSPDSVADEKTIPAVGEQMKLLQDNCSTIDDADDNRHTGVDVRDHVKAEQTCNKLTTYRTKEALVKKTDSHQAKTWLKVLCFPDVWFLTMGFLADGIGVVFLYMNMVSFTLDAHFSEQTAAWIMSTMGISELIGKIVVGIAADRLPVPKILMIMVSNCIGAALMLASRFVSTLAFMYCLAAGLGFFVTAAVNSLPHSVASQLYSPQFTIQLWAIIMMSMGIGGVFGAVFGTSVDKTGSYVTALYGNVGIFLGSTVFFALVPTYQWFFSRERFIVLDNMKKRFSEANLVTDLDETKNKNPDGNRLEIAEIVTSI